MAHMQEHGRLILLPLTVHLDTDSDIDVANKLVSFYENCRPIYELAQDYLFNMQTFFQRRSREVKLINFTIPSSYSDTVNDDWVEQILLIEAKSQVLSEWTMSLSAPLKYLRLVYRLIDNKPTNSTSSASIFNDFANHITEDPSSVQEDQVAAYFTEYIQTIPIINTVCTIYTSGNNNESIWAFAAMMRDLVLQVNSGLKELFQKREIAIMRQTSIDLLEQFREACEKNIPRPSYYLPQAEKRSFIISPYSGPRESPYAYGIPAKRQDAKLFSFSGVEPSPAAIYTSSLSKSSNQDDSLDSSDIQSDGENAVEDQEIKRKPKQSKASRKTEVRQNILLDEEEEEDFDNDKKISIKKRKAPDSKRKTQISKKKRKSREEESESEEEEESESEEEPEEEEEEKAEEDQNDDFGSKISTIKEVIHEEPVVKNWVPTEKVFASAIKDLSRRVRAVMIDIVIPRLQKKSKQTDVNLLLTSLVKRSLPSKKAQIMKELLRAYDLADNYKLWIQELSGFSDISDLTSLTTLVRDSVKAVCVYNDIPCTGIASKEFDRMKLVYDKFIAAVEPSITSGKKGVTIKSIVDKIPDEDASKADFLDCYYSFDNHVKLPGSRSVFGSGATTQSSLRSAIFGICK